MEGVRVTAPTPPQPAAAAPFAESPLEENGPAGLPQKPPEHFGSSGVAPGWTKHAKIHEAAQAGDLASVEALLASGISVNAKAAVRRRARRA
eukprot:6317842-Prymnesium_polylepis.1